MYFIKNFLISIIVSICVYVGYFEDIPKVSELGKFVFILLIVAGYAGGLFIFIFLALASDKTLRKCDQPKPKLKHTLYFSILNTIIVASSGAYITAFFYVVVCVITRLVSAIYRDELKRVNAACSE